MWSLISPRAKRISGSRNFRSSPQKDFFNTIGASGHSTKREVRKVPRTDMELGSLDK